MKFKFIVAIIPTTANRLGRQYQVFDTLRQAKRFAVNSPYWQAFPRWCIHIFRTTGHALTIEGKFAHICTYSTKVQEIYKEGMGNING